MRFETSQSTPSYLDRRLQFRMLSFVGLISLVMVGLAVMNRHPSPTTDVANRKSTISPDSLTYEVRREAPVLNPGEVIIAPIVEDNGPRGQIADAKSEESSQTDLAGDDIDRFKPRSQERTSDNRFFARRSIPATKTETNTFTDDERTRTVQPATSDFAFNDDGTDDRANEWQTPSRPKLAKSLPATTPASSLETEWIPSNDSADRARNEFDQDELPPREPPTFDVETPKSSTVFDDDRRNKPRQGPTGQTAPKDAPMFDDDQTPLRSHRPESDPIDSPRKISKPGVNDFPDEEPIQRRPAKSRKNTDFQTESPPIDQDPFSMPARTRKKDKLWQTQPPESEPFSEDFESVRIDKRYLDQVKDNTLGIRKDESEIFYWMVDHARRVTTEALDRSGLSDVQFVNLMTEPDQFRGDPITIEGDLWRLYEVDAGPNEYGVKRMYEGWVFTSDSGHHPYRIVCTSLAKGIHPAESLRKPVRITGYFFKREGYRSNGGVHIAPTLIAHRIEINPTPNGIPLMAGIVPYMSGAILAIALALLVTVAAFAISDERSRSDLEKSRTNLHVTFGDLQVAPTISIEETLRQLAERERESIVRGAYGPLMTRQAAREHAVHDEAASRQRQSDDERRQFEQQAQAIHKWAVRHQTNQWETHTLDTTKAAEPSYISLGRDELSSDMLEPARHVVSHDESIDESISIPDHAPVAPNHAFAAAVTPVIQIPAPILPPPVPPTEPSFQPVVEVNPPAADFAFSASKLSEWEDEVTRMNRRTSSRTIVTQPDIAPLEQTAAAQIERDRQAREQETRDRIAREKAETDRLHGEQSRQPDQIPHEHHAGQKNHEMQFDFDEEEIDDGATFTLSPSADSRADRERLERERLEREHHAREHLNQEHIEHERHGFERGAANRSNINRTDRDQRAAS